MARRYLIVFLSFLLVTVLAFALQAHDPSWNDFFGWFGLFGLIIAALELVAGLICLLIPGRKLGKEILISAALLLLVGGAVFLYITYQGMRQ